MVRIAAVWLLASYITNPAIAQPIGDPPLPDFFAKQSDDTAVVVSLNYEQLMQLQLGNLQLDTVLNVGRLRVGTPYLWGGDSWTEGVDCSHFTRTVFATAATGYESYMQTAQLRDLREGNGMRQVPREQMQPGDLLVYGYYDELGAWSGHVVVLIDAGFAAGGYHGLVLGSHGDVGVQFLTVAGFPEYFRKPHIELRNVLRVATRDF